MQTSMTNPTGMWRRFTAAYAAFLNHLVVVAVAILVVPVTVQITSRYTELIPAYIWTEEMARFLFIWTIMIGAMLGVRNAAHFDVDLLPAMGPRVNAAMRIVSRLGVLVIAVIFVIGGIEFTRFAWNRTSELAELPLWLIHIAWPMAGVTWLVFMAEQFIDDFRIASGRTSDQ
mgnify:CR=1 FL=1